VYLILYRFQKRDSVSIIICLNIRMLLVYIVFLGIPIVINGSQHNRESRMPGSDEDRNHRRDGKVNRRRRRREQAAVTTTTTTEEIVRCQTDALMRENRCICGENPCFNAEPFLHVPRGREVPDLMESVYSRLSAVIEWSGASTHFDTHYKPDSLVELERNVQELYEACWLVSKILPEDDDDVLYENRWARDARSILRSHLEGFRPWNEFDAEISDKKRFSISTHGSKTMKPLVLRFQAFEIVSKYILHHVKSDFENGGWEPEFEQLGIYMVHDAPLPVPVLPESVRLERISELSTHILLTEGALSEIPLYGEKLNVLADVLSEFMNTGYGDTEFKREVSEMICSNTFGVLEYIDNFPLPFARRKAQLIADVIRFCSTSLVQMINLAQSKLVTFDQEFIESEMGHVRPIRLRIPMRAKDSTIRSSRRFLEAESSEYHFPYGIIVDSSDTAAEGHGVRKTWVENLVSFYFKAYDPAVPRTSDAAWMYSDSTRTSIKPRPLNAFESPERKRTHRVTLRACGRLIGIAIRYGIVPAIPLSPASLKMLQRPSDDFDASEVAQLEDPQFCAGLDALKDLDDGQLGVALGDETISVGGQEHPITKANVEEYIRRKKFGLAVWAIHSEMNIVRKGIQDFLRPGILDLLTNKDLTDLIQGSIPVTADVLLSGFQFPQPDVGSIKGWFQEIVSEMEEPQLKDLLRFVTGSSQPPVDAATKTWMGFTAHEELDKDRLPTAQTCFGTLITPKYDAKNILKEKLLLALNEGMTIEEK
jgi:hypothetical protein